MKAGLITRSVRLRVSEAEAIVPDILTVSAAGTTEASCGKD